MPNWLPAELRAWAPPEEITVAEWAEKYRQLPIKLSPEPGPWRNDKAPYTIELMNDFKDSIVERITIMGSVQSSKTEPAYNMLGFAMDQDPGPALIVMPTDKAIKKVNVRIQHMIADSPQLLRHTTGNPDDIKQKEINLQSMTLWFATAGSSADLRHVSARYIYLDETDDYPPETGDQGSPTEMAEARATTFWNRKIIESCTPTIEEQYINQSYERSDKRKYWVPCPYCHGYQVLDFFRIKHKGEKLGEWPKDKRDPEYIVRRRVARYECEHCHEEIDDRHKAWMMKYGTWIPAGPEVVKDAEPGIPEPRTAHKGHWYAIGKDGTAAIPRPRTAHRGYWWSALYSRWRTFSEIAAKFFDAQGDVEKLKTFWNLWLALPWKEKHQEREQSEILTLRTEYEPFIVPAGAVALTAGVDTQKYGFWITIRAWFRDFPRSHLVRHGYVETWDELEQWIFHDIYPSEPYDQDKRILYPVWRTGIDIGGGEADDPDSTMTEQVYEWIRTMGRPNLFGVRGSPRQLGGGKKMTMTIIDRMPGKRGRVIPGGIRLWHLNTGAFKDAIWARIEAEKFSLHKEADSVYARHITAEAKEKDKKGHFHWTVQGSRPNHLLDCEVYAAAMADPECGGGVIVVPDPKPSTTPPPSKKDQGFVGRRSDQWLKR